MSVCVLLRFCCCTESRMFCLCDSDNLRFCSLPLQHADGTVAEHQSTRRQRCKGTKRRRLRFACANRLFLFIAAASRRHASQQHAAGAASAQGNSISAQLLDDIASVLRANQSVEVLLVLTALLRTFVNKPCLCVFVCSCVLCAGVASV